MRWLLALPLLFVFGCKPDPSHVGDASSRTSGGDSRDYVGKDALVDINQLRFISADEQRIFLAARQCFATRGALWEHYPLRQIGNFVNEEWCRGKGAAINCTGGGFREQAASEWTSVDTLYYPKDWPQVFGLLIAAGRNVPVGDKSWSVAFSVTSNGKSIVGQGAHISFRREKDQIHIGSGYEWQVVEQRFAKSNADDPWAIFERLRGSSKALRDEGITSWRALEAEVVSALEKNEVKKCRYGEYKGNGIPPACIGKVPLDAQENQKELAKIRSTVARIVEVLENEHVAMHAALLELGSTDCIPQPVNAPKP